MYDGQWMGQQEKTPCLDMHQQDWQRLSDHLTTSIAAQGQVPQLDKAACHKSTASHHIEGEVWNMQDGRVTAPIPKPVDQQSRSESCPVQASCLTP